MVETLNRHSTFFRLTADLTCVEENQNPHRISLFLNAKGGCNVGTTKHGYDVCHLEPRCFLAIEKPSIEHSYPGGAGIGFKAGFGRRRWRLAVVEAEWWWWWWFSGGGGD